MTREDPQARVVVNGGNCAWSDVNWVHMVHAAWREPLPAELPSVTRLRLGAVRRLDVHRERRIIGAARVVIANSRRTAADLERALGLSPARVRVVYLGVDARRFGPVEAAERERARAELGLSLEAPAVAFVAGIGHDRKKGFDHLLEAWGQVVRARPGATLLVAGGDSTGGWGAAMGARGLAGSVRLLGEVSRVEGLLAACDLLVCPSRYDAYGMSVHEAACRGVLTLVSTAAGISERYPPQLAALVAPPPGAETPSDYAQRILGALSPSEQLASAYRELCQALRARSWDDMAHDLVSEVERCAPGRAP